MAIGLRRLKRVAEVDLDKEELAKIVRAAQLFVEGKSQQDIAAAFPVSVSTVARWLARAAREGILQTRVVAPTVLALEKQLGSIVAPRGVRAVSVVPNGAEKNIDNLGLAGAREVMQAITAQIERGTSRNSITIALSCGTTVTSVIENLIDILYQRQIVEGRPLSHALEIYPTVLFGDSTLDPIYPHTIVTYFAMLARNAGLKVLDSKEPLISARAIQLPEGFYGRGPKERNEYKQQWRLDDFVAKIKEADIFVLGAGNLTADSYGKISRQLAIESRVHDLLKDEAMVQVLYAPLNDDGLPDDDISDKIVGLTVKDVREKARDPAKRVILVAGGDEKVKSLQRAIKFPCYNVLITDVGVAEEAIRLNASGG